MLALLLIFLQLPNLAMNLYLAAIFRRPQKLKTIKTELLCLESEVMH